MKRRILTAIMLAAVAWLAGPQARADVKPHSLFSDGMVLQQGVSCPIWGTADAGEQVSVVFEATKPRAATTLAAAVSADDDGKWRINLHVAPEMAGGPYTLTIKGKNSITLKDVYVGEVWVCSGQSNMEWPLRATENAEETIENAKNPNIRLFTVQKNPSDKRTRPINRSMASRAIRNGVNAIPIRSRVSRPWPITSAVSCRSRATCRWV
jgi:sialate O-acetylesterase